MTWGSQHVVSRPMVSIRSIMWCLLMWHGRNVAYQWIFPCSSSYNTHWASLTQVTELPVSFKTSLVVSIFCSFFMLRWSNTDCLKRHVAQDFYIVKTYKSNNCKLHLFQIYLRSQVQRLRGRLGTLLSDKLSSSISLVCYTPLFVWSLLAPTKPTW